VTAVKIREIHQLKEEAVAREDYDEAARLRDGINRLKAVGAKVAQLEARKRAAVESEDYDAAKVGEGGGAGRTRVDCACLQTLLPQALPFNA